jgi:hypothetical protein
MKYFACLIFLFLYGCEVFTSREAELPEQPRSNYQVATSIDLLMQNFTNSLLDKNTQNYLSCFTDSSFSKKKFVFIPSAESISQFPILIQNWNKHNEEHYFNNLCSKLSQDVGITIVFTNISMNPQGDSAFYSANYSLAVPHKDIVSPKFFQGEIKLKLIRDSRLIWTIYSWQDLKNSSNSSWSELKGYFY